MVGTESSEVVADSTEETEEPQNDRASSSLANRELVEEYDEERMREIQKRWYHVDFEYKFNFPEGFDTVPAHQSANRIWMRPMDYEEVGHRLLGTKDNVEPNILPETIIRFYSEIVESASNKFADLQQKIDDNEHHIKVLHSARERGKPPNFLKLQAPEVRLFPADTVSALQKSFRDILDKAELDMLECTLKERRLLRAKLCREAEQLVEEVEEEAMTKWMEAQGEWNGWDHIYPVTAEATRDDRLVRLKVPLSSNVFRIALKECRAKVSTLMETKRLERTQEAANRKKEQRQRKQALNEASALPRQEAEKSMQRRMQDMMQPLIADVRKIKEQLQGNRSAPVAADAGGASDKSAKKSRKLSPTRSPSDPDQDASAEAQRGKKKKRLRSREAKLREDPAPATPSSKSSGDRSRKTGSGKGCKQGGSRSKRAARNDDE